MKVFYNFQLEITGLISVKFTYTFQIKFISLTALKHFILNYIFNLLDHQECSSACPPLLMPEMVRTWKLYLGTDSQGTWTQLTGWFPLKSWVKIIFYCNVTFISMPFFAAWCIALVISVRPFNCHVYIAEILHPYQNYSKILYYLIWQHTYYVFYFFMCLIDYFL